ncbi:MAG TPA: diacylglycerol kinase family protein [Kineosporiaceae bacterium]|nr:diacylglycerol kinase family protein [Kineosporiaceae bacterium]
MGVVTWATSASGPAKKRVRLAVAGLAFVLAGVAVSRGARAVRHAGPPGRAVPPARHAVLILNLGSGGGKAERFGLVGECRRRGIEPVVLTPGQDLAGVAEAAVAGGADVIGMAGGDGSLGTVAGVAARHGVAMVVVPAGTRNHLAMDLGLDRSDVVGALDAFAAARERAVDLGEVNGRVFVNTASLGLYAEIIRSPQYRDAKLDTTLSALPRLLGPESRPFDLRFTGPAGERHTGAHVVHVSNNPYGRTPTTLASRPRLDCGRLGLVALELPDAAAVAAFRTAVAAGRPERLPGVLTWEASTFTVDSGGPIDVGIDGESLRLTPPLRFVVRPAALRIRLPRRASGLSPAARELRARSAVRGLRGTHGGAGSP